MEMDKTIGENDISLYVGIPFCPSRCYYCSFVSATTAQSGKLIEPYLDTLCREIEETAALVRAAGKQVQSVYIAAAHRPRWTSISWHGCCQRSKITLIFHICANIL